MYILRIGPLKDDLINGRVTEKERFKYLLGWVFLGMVPAVLEHFMPSNTSSPEESIFFLLVAVFSVYFAYRRNGGREGKDLLGRYLSVGLVVTLRIITLALGLLAISWLAGGMGGDGYYEEGPPEWTSLISTVLVLAICIYYVWAIGRHIRDVHRAADLGFFAHAVPEAPVPPRAPAIPGQAGLPRPTSLQLEKFVETVVQREMGSGGKAISAGSAVLRQSSRKAAGPKRRPVLRRRTRK